VLGGDRVEMRVIGVVRLHGEPMRVRWLGRVGTARNGWSDLCPTTIAAGACC
jgi:hypothetical protein